MHFIFTLRRTIALIALLLCALVALPSEAVIPRPGTIPRPYSLGVRPLGPTFNPHMNPYALTPPMMNPHMMSPYMMNPMMMQQPMFMNPMLMMQMQMMMSQMFGGGERESRRERRERRRERLDRIDRELSRTSRPTYAQSRLSPPAPVPPVDLSDAGPELEHEHEPINVDTDTSRLVQATERLLSESERLRGLAEDFFARDEFSEAEEMAEEAKALADQARVWATQMNDQVLIAKADDEIRRAELIRLSAQSAQSPRDNSCSLIGGTVSNGQTHRVAFAATVPRGGTCQFISRTCTNGQLSGDSGYNYFSCTVESRPAEADNDPCRNVINAVSPVTIVEGQVCTGACAFQFATAVGNLSISDLVDNINYCSSLRTPPRDRLFHTPIPGCFGNEAECAITSPYGGRRDPFTGVCAAHHGIDIDVTNPEDYPDGVPIFTIAEGRVITSQPIPGYGNVVEVLHDIQGECFISRYAHLRDGDSLIGRGEPVSSRSRVATMGRTGRSTGDHLHLEIYRCSHRGAELIRGVEVDPTRLVDLPPYQGDRECQ